MALESLSSLAWQAVLVLLLLLLIAWLLRSLHMDEKFRERQALRRELFLEQKRNQASQAMSRDSALKATRGVIPVKKP